MSGKPFYIDPLQKFILNKSHVLRFLLFLFSPPPFHPFLSLESTDLTRSFSDQGVRIRIRKEARAGTTPT